MVGFDLTKLSKEMWFSVNLETHPDVHILHSKWRVTETLNAVERGTEWKHPEHQPATVLVWRQNAQVNYREIGRCGECSAELIYGGVSFGRYLRPDQRLD
jgi:hypothetical protein